MSCFLTLPDSLQGEIFLFLELADQLELAKVNCEIAYQWKKEVRRIEIKSEEKVNEFFRSQSLREHLFSLINEPSRQLKIDSRFASSKYLKNCDLCQLKLQEFRADMYDYMTIFQQKVPNLEKLILSCRYGEVIVMMEQDGKKVSCNLTAQLFGLSSIHIKNLFMATKLDVADLFGSQYPWKGALNVPMNENLRCVKIVSCPLIHDVSHFDGIYDLHIEQCYGFTDISCLNNNYKITMKDCSMSLDYSKSFKNSHSITLSSSAPWRHDFPLHYLACVRDLSLTGNFMITSDDVDVLPHKLMKLHLINNNHIAKIPLNSLKEVLIRNCSSFSSCENLKTIRKINLEYLSINSLEGLGRSNYQVKILCCNQLSDFSVLNFCRKVEIIDCTGLKGLSQLSEIQEFRLHYSPSYNHKDLQRITDLEVDPSHYFSLQLSIVSMNQRLKFQSIILKGMTFHLTTLLLVIINLTDIRKIVIESTSLNDRLYIMKVLEAKKLLVKIRKSFTIEQPSKRCTLVLLRR